MQQFKDYESVKQKETTRKKKLKDHNQNLNILVTEIFKPIDFSILQVKLIVIEFLIPIQNLILRIHNQ